MYYLYIKQHNKTKLKYLGYTKNKNPYKYKGSGTYWSRHIKKYGYDVTTTILLATTEAWDIKNTGLFFSSIFNVVESKEWANLKKECLDGGWDYVNEYVNKTPERKAALIARGVELGKKNKNTVSVKTLDNKTVRVPSSVFDSSDDLVGHTKGITYLYDDSGNKVKVKTGTKKEGLHGNNYKKIYITDGKNNKLIKRTDEVPLGWRIGISDSKNKHNVGKMWITNGLKEKMIFKTESIPNGWRRGRT